MAIKDIEFEEAIQQCSGNKSCLLGNGFSRAANQVFSYTSLREKSKLSEFQEKLFKDFNTDDFESIISALETSKQTMRIYDEINSSMINQYLENESARPRNKFIEAISHHHIKYNDIFNDNNEPSSLDCSKFLNTFTNIFTTNYDMLLYWSIMYAIENKVPTPQNDGFNRYDYMGIYHEDRHLIWLDPARLEYISRDHPNLNKSQNIFYLHGSLFLYISNDDNFIYKEEYKQSKNILKLIEQKFCRNYLPLIVLEGGSDFKLKKILSNPYLNHCYTSLRSLNEPIFIIGHSLKDTDKHIIDAINQSNSKNIYVSYYDNEEEIREKVKLFDSTGKKISVFKINDDQIWKKNYRPS